MGKAKETLRVYLNSCQYRAVHLVKGNYGAADMSLGGVRADWTELALLGTAVGSGSIVLTRRHALQVLMKVQRRDTSDGLHGCGAGLWQGAGR